MNKNTLRFVGQIFAMIVSAFLMAVVVNSMMEPSNLLSGGFTGLAIIIEKLTLIAFGKGLPLSIGILIFNIPLAFVCYKHVSHRFTILSVIQVVATSIFIEIIKVEPIFTSLSLNIIFGGALYGIALLIALRFSGSSGGTDFIALLVSNKTGKTIWSEIFVFNCVLIFIFGLASGWEAAGHSIIFQFITTKLIESNYHRYECFTVQATTKYPEDVVNQFIQHSHHGISTTEIIGGYSKQKMYMLNTVISAYELDETIALMKKVDPEIIINVYKTEKFIGKFYRKPID